MFTGAWAAIGVSPVSISGGWWEDEKRGLASAIQRGERRKII